MGTEVTIVGLMDRIVPVEDEDVSKELARSFKKQGIKTMTSAEVHKIDTKSKTLKVHVKTKKGVEVIECDQVLSAVGVVGNIENLGLEEVGVKTERGTIVVDEFNRTNEIGRASCRETAQN